MDVHVIQRLQLAVDLGNIFQFKQAHFSSPMYYCHLFRDSDPPLTLP